jgi:hypothetical protein
MSPQLIEIGDIAAVTISTSSQPFAYNRRFTRARITSSPSIVTASDFATEGKAVTCARHGGANAGDAVCEVDGNDIVAQVFHHARRTGEARCSCVALHTLDETPDVPFLIIVEELRLGERWNTSIEANAMSQTRVMDSQLGARPLSGVGDDGTPFSTINIGIFMDDFQARPGKYFGGVYMTYISAKSRYRSGSQAAHIISVTPPGVCSDENLLSICDDMYSGKTEGVLARDPLGNAHKIFIDFSMFSAD